MKKLINSRPDLGFSGAYLSDEVAESSYGIPVLIFNGRAYGREDIPACGEFSIMNAAMLVRAAIPDAERDDFINAFLGEK